MPSNLLAVLPNAVFALVDKCLVLCYKQGDILSSWLVSETFCVFNGKDSWRDPNRWRPIAISKRI